MPYFKDDLVVCSREIERSYSKRGKMFHSSDNSSTTSESECEIGLGNEWVEFEPHCDSVEHSVTEQETSSHIQRESSFTRDKKELAA